MTNSIRTPKQGVTASSRRIAQAVDDEEWQKFRVSLKGQSTANKLHKLEEYYEYGDSRTHEHNEFVNVDMDCDFCIRVDNYIKALCRGGQLYGGESLQTALASNWHLRIKRN